MNRPAESPVAMLERAMASSDPAALEQAIAELEARYPAQPFTLYGKAEAAQRRGDIEQAAAFSATAVSTLFDHRLLGPAGRLDLRSVFDACMDLDAARLTDGFAYFAQMGRLLEASGAMQGLAPGLARIAERITHPAHASRLTPAHVETAFALLGFGPHCSTPWSDQVVERLALPWLLTAAERGDFNTALNVESPLYNAYVKRQESGEWFKASTARWIPALAASARRHRPAAMHTTWRPRAERRIGLFLHNASMLAHVVVMIETLRAASEVGTRAYAFTVFVCGGRDATMHAALGACGVRVRYLDEGRPYVSYFERLQILETELRRDNFAAIFWVTQVTMMAVMFARRIAPLQGWWSMKYHACEIDEIDTRLAVESVVLRKSMQGHEWRTLGSASTAWLDPALADGARRLRAQFPADALVAACLGREEKLDSPAFLEAVCDLLRAHANLHFLWTGRLPRASIQGAFERAGVAQRTRFVGWVNTRLYAQAIDLFLDSFPFPCGFTLKEAMAAGKPAVMMRTPESLETGVPGAITPLIEGTAQAPATARDRLRAIFTREHDFDLYPCAATPTQYVAMANALIADPALRMRVGEANRAFIEAFLSSPEDEARKFLDHLDEVFTTIPTQP
jgi:glycosyltransferase involved in cell wall biosynthesis